MTALLDTSKLIVGASGSGKTVTAKDEVDQLLAQNRHVAIVDPTGVWWGMRADPAGEPNGAQLYIFGGAHGDVAITEDQGAAIARIIVEQRVSAIVDLSSIETSKGWRRFMRDFIAELRRKPRGNFHLVMDEADEFAAERPADDIGFALREDLIWIAKRGRVAGFVPTWITQRTAEIAKAVISQAQTIVAHQLIAPTDRKAIDDYLKGHGTPEARREVMASLAALGRGERWIYSPAIGLLDRGITPPLATFDSSRTPEPGETPLEARPLAALDTSAIAAALAPPASAGDYPDDKIPADPVAAYRKGGDVAAMLIERDAEIADLRAANALLEGTTKQLARERDAARVELGRDRSALLGGLNAAIGDLTALRERMERGTRAAQPPSASSESKSTPGPGRQSATKVEGAPAGGNSARREPAGAPANLNRTAIDAAEYLKSLAPDGFRWNDILLAIGRRPNSGDSRKARNLLIDQQLVYCGGELIGASQKLCDDDAFALAHVRSATELVELWAEKLRGPGADILRDLASNGPSPSAEIAFRLSRSPTSGWWRLGIKDLKGSNLIREEGRFLHLHPLLVEADD